MNNYFNVLRDSEKEYTQADYSDVYSEIFFSENLMKNYFFEKINDNSYGFLSVENFKNYKFFEKIVDDIKKSIDGLDSFNKVNFSIDMPILGLISVSVLDRANTLAVNMAAKSFLTYKKLNEKKDFLENEINRFYRKKTKVSIIYE